MFISDTRFPQASASSAVKRGGDLDCVFFSLRFAELDAKMRPSDLEVCDTAMPPGSPLGCC